MKLRFAAAVVLGGLCLSAAWASPVRVRTSGAKSQSVQMCPDCSKKIKCAVVGDHLIGLAVDLGNAKANDGTLVVHVMDKSKQPVTDAEVTIDLSMPKHGHDTNPLTAAHVSHGKYVARTNTIGMGGRWTAVVSVKTAGDDTVKQAFGFTK